ITVSNGKLLFEGTNSAGQVGLWTSDGTGAGTHELTGIGGAFTGGLSALDLTSPANKKPSDFNGDGTGDILWRDTTTGQVAEWKMSNGAIAANGVSVIGSAANNWQIAGSGDFNGDGTSDIVWRDGNTGQAAVWTMQNGAIAANGVAVIGSAANNWQIAGTG